MAPGLGHDVSRVAGSDQATADADKSSQAEGQRHLSYRKAAVRPQVAMDEAIYATCSDLSPIKAIATIVVPRLHSILLHAFSRLGTASGKHTVLALKLSSLRPY